MRIGEICETTKILCKILSPFLFLGASKPLSYPPWILWPLQMRRKRFLIMKNKKCEFVMLQILTFNFIFWLKFLKSTLTFYLAPHWWWKYLGPHLCGLSSFNVSRMKGYVILLGLLMASSAFNSHCQPRNLILAGKLGSSSATMALAVSVGEKERWKWVPECFSWSFHSNCSPNHFPTP